MAHDVFISHSAKDKTVADAVCAALESEGIRCWIAPRDVLPSMEWSEAIIDAIEECRIMVLVFTANANASPQIRREVERAVNHGVAMLPVRIEDVLPGKGLEYFIGNVHWLDALKPPLDAHLKNLAGTIKILLARTEPGASSMAPQEVRLPASSGHGAGRGIPEVAGGRETALGPRHFWSSRASTWAAGTVAALLLVAVFVGVHFSSHPAPVALPQPVLPSVQGTPGPARPSGASPVTPGPQGTVKPAGASPGGTAGNATTLQNTMRILQGELSGAASVSFALVGQNRNDGSNLRQTKKLQFSNIVADPVQCRVSYHRKLWLNGSAQPSTDADSWFQLHGVTRVSVESLSQFLTELNAASGQPNLIVNSTTPPVAALTAFWPGGYNEITLPDMATANRAANTMKQAVKLCGGTLTN